MSSAEGWPPAVVENKFIYNLKYSRLLGYIRIVAALYTIKKKEHRMTIPIDNPIVTSIIDPHTCVDWSTTRYSSLIALRSDLVFVFH